MSHAHLGKPAELPSTEKLERHQVVGGPNGTGQCKKCQLSYPSALCPTMEVLISRPCMGYSTSGKVQILYSKNWPQELQILAKNLDIENWQAMAHSGRKFRIGPNARLSESPEPHEFPLLLEPVTHEQLLEELEELQLQEELLREQLQLVELEKALNDEQQKLVAEAIQQAPKGCPLVVDLKLLFLGEVLLNIWSLHL